MNKANITQAKNSFSQLLDRVRHGQTIIIMDRRCPVARLAPIVEESEHNDTAGRIRRLIRAGLMTPSRRATKPKQIFDTPPPAPTAGASAVQALLNERENGR